MVRAEKGSEDKEKLKGYVELGFKLIQTALVPPLVWLYLEQAEINTQLQITNHHLTSTANAVADMHATIKTDYLRKDLQALIDLNFQRQLDEIRKEEERRKANVKPD